MLNAVYAYVANLIYFKVWAVSRIILMVNPNLKGSFYIGKITFYHPKLHPKLYFTP